MQVTLVGMGSGMANSLTLEAINVLQNADLILGAKRLLSALPDGCTQNRKSVYQPESVLEAIEQANSQETALVYSGDTGFYSGAAQLVECFKARGIECRVLPGISSVQMLSAALGRPWQNWHLVSAHGVACDAVAECTQGEPTFFLTGGSETPATLCAQLCAEGYGNVEVTVAERLGRDKERIMHGTAQQMAVRRFDPLSVLLVEATELPAHRCGGWPDEAFCRGSVPMTKQEVRAAALGKLGVRPNEVLWDVGAGTGSMSVEMALCATKGRVYAVECNPEACELIEENRVKFSAYNLTLIEGKAPQALEQLPAPDAIFVGGTKGNMAAIIDVAIKKNPSVRICISAIALESLQAAITSLTAHGIEAQVVQISVSHSRVIGALHMMQANNPVYLISGTAQQGE